MFVLQILFILFTGVLIPTQDLTQYHNGKFNAHQHYPGFIRSFIWFSKKFYTIWCDIVEQQIKGSEWQRDQWNITYMNALFPISEINEQFLNAAQVIKQQFVIPETRWDKLLRPPLQSIANKFFYGIIKIIPSFQIVQERYIQSTKWIITNQIFAASTLELCQATMNNISGQYTEINNIILLQLITPTIFSKMKLLNIYEKDKLIKENLCKYKFIHDGYSMNNARTIELLTLTNVSIPFMGQTSSNCDVVGAFDIGKEGREKLFQVLQIYGIQLLLLGTIGTFHPITNSIIHFQISRPADTHATQFSIGSPSFSGGSGHLYTTHAKKDVYKIHNVCPINRTALHVNERWNSCMDDNWDKIQAYADKHFPNQQIDRHNLWMKCEEFDKLKAKIREFTNDYSYVRSPWLIAACIYDFGTDGLHGEMNVTAMVAKYCILASHDLYAEELNSCLTADQINHHIYKCIKLKCSFPTTNRQKGGIKLFGNNIRALISDWNKLKRLVQCDKCSFDPFQHKFSAYINTCINLLSSIKLQTRT